MARRSCIWALFLLMLISLPVSAESAAGRICLTLRYQGTPVSGGAVTLYDVSDLETSDDPEVMLKSIKSSGTSGMTQDISREGTVCYSDLKEGRYLLVQDRAPEGFYAVKPFLVSIPITVGNQLVYDVEASPKLQKIPEMQLPQTGMRNLPVWGLLGGGLMLTALGLLLQKRK